MRTADNIPVGAKRLAEPSYQVRPILEGTNRGRHFETKTPANGSDTSRSQAPVNLRPYASRRSRRAPKISTPGYVATPPSPRPSASPAPRGRKRRSRRKLQSMGKKSGQQ